MHDYSLDVTSSQVNFKMRQYAQNRGGQKHSREQRLLCQQALWQMCYIRSRLDSPYLILKSHITLFIDRNPCHNAGMIPSICLDAVRNTTNLRQRTGRTKRVQTRHVSSILYLVSDEADARSLACCSPQRRRPTPAWTHLAITASRGTRIQHGGSKEVEPIEDHCDFVVQWPEHSILGERDRYRAFWSVRDVSVGFDKRGDNARMM